MELKKRQSLGLAGQVQIRVILGSQRGSVSKNKMNTWLKTFRCPPLTFQIVHTGKCGFACLHTCTHSYVQVHTDRKKKKKEYCLTENLTNLTLSTCEGGDWLAFQSLCWFLRREHPPAPSESCLFLPDRTFRWLMKTEWLQSYILGLV